MSVEAAANRSAWWNVEILHNVFYNIQYKFNAYTWRSTIWIILSKFKAYTMLEKVWCQSFKLKAFKWRFVVSVTFVSGKHQRHFTEFQFLHFSAQNKNTYKFKILLHYCIRMEITVLYFKLWGSKSWFYSLKYPFS